MSTSPIRLNPALISAAEREAMMQKRSTPKQIEYWADLGRVVAQVIDMSDVFAVLQGLKRLRLEDVESVVVEPEDVFSDLQAKASQGYLSKALTTSSIYYEASKDHPGMIDQVDSATGARRAGRFQNGVFESHI